MSKVLFVLFGKGSRLLGVQFEQDFSWLKFYLSKLLDG